VLWGLLLMHHRGRESPESSAPAGAVFLANLPEELHSTDVLFRGNSTRLLPARKRCKCLMVSNLRANRLLHGQTMGGIIWHLIQTLLVPIPLMFAITYYPAFPRNGVARVGSAETGFCHYPESSAAPSGDSVSRSKSASRDQNRHPAAFSGWRPPCRVAAIGFAASR
jgi:hypothetical protein